MLPAEWSETFFLGLFLEIGPGTIRCKRVGAENNRNGETKGVEWLTLIPFGAPSTDSEVWSLFQLS